MVAPLKGAPDDVAWAAELERVLEPWFRLRLAFVAAFIELQGAGALEELQRAGRMAEEVPLTLLPEPAHGAARHAVALLGAIAEGVVASARRRTPLDLALLEALTEDIAIIELAWLTIAGPDRPRAVVAEAAAWEAYSRVRPLRSLVARAGLDVSMLPCEARDEAAARAREMLGRVAHGWTMEEEAAVHSSRLPPREFQA